MTAEFPGNDFAGDPELRAGRGRAFASARVPATPEPAREQPDDDLASQVPGQGG